MYPLNDKDLDRLSREAAEQYDVESSATGWDLVENRLNTEMPVKAEKERRRFLLWLFFIALMAGGGLVYMLGGSKSNTSIAQSRQSQAVNSNKQTATNNPTDNSTTGTPTKAPTTQNNKNTKDNSATGRPNETVSSKTISDKVSQQPANKNSIVPGTRIRTYNRPANTALILANTSQVNRGQKHKSSIGKNNPVKGNNVDVAKTDPAVNSKSNQGKNGINENDAESNVANSNANKDQQPKEDAANTAVNNQKAIVAPAADNNTAKKDNAEKVDQKAPELTAASAAAKKPNSKSSAPIKNPLEIGFLVGPDQSYIKFKAGDNTGLNLGLTIGYRFSNRWSMNTGLILEKKNYKADGEDFKSPRTDWTSYVKMNAIDGTCSMFDIPLNVRYDLSYNDKRRFFVSTGLTSYLMHHQTYDYYFTNSIGQNLERNWYTDSSMNYFMSVFNLSVGFERTLGKHLSFQAEPYLKIPLKGLGYGSMKMDSYGIFFSLKYKPEFGKKGSK